jgi:tRNA pseudouridine13 synthase
VTQALPDFDDALLPRALSDDGPAASGPIALRADVEDFRVDEVPLYAPTGAGEHLYLHVEKRGVSTPDLLRRLGQRFRVHERDIGVAGLKDARGITTQWVSLPARAVDDPAAVAELGPFVVLQSARHGNKLRMGHLRANRFSIRLRGPIDVPRLRARAALLSNGFPNAFGAQRFGPASASIRQAERFVSFARRPRSRKERFLVSVAQSVVFNRWLALRVEEGTWDQPLSGDVLVKRENGAPFSCTDPAADAPRMARGEVDVAGPLPGPKMRPAGGDALTRESRSLASLGMDFDPATHPAFDAGARRPARVVADAIEITGEDDGARVAFTLPPGCYATVFLRNCVGRALVDELPEGDAEN